MMKLALRQLAPLSAVLLLAAAAQAADTLPLPDLRWRLVGPFRGGWATSTVGVPARPDTYFVGTAGGGVWKTANAGRTWAPVSDAAGITAVSALAIAQSDPNVLYAGTGHPETRYDIEAGDGIYRSGDGGKTWEHRGLAAVRHIGAILVDPRDPNVVTVAAVGHVYAEGPDRGIYRSVDGGKSWTQVEFIDNAHGFVDLAADPANPDLVYAAAWAMRNWPWQSYFTPVLGGALYKSTDGGKTWAPLAGEGWPKQDIGRIGLAITDTAQGVRIYATIDSDDAGGIWRSDDGGGHWQRVNDDTDAFSSSYFSRLIVGPENADTIYVTGQSVRRSTDGGKTFDEFKGAPGGDDYHAIWINPQHPDHMIVASDQGAVASVDGGATWSDWYNQPTGEFYHLAADNRFPYWIYSGQQDSGTVGTASRSDYGTITFRDWHPVGGDERDDDIPDPTDPDIVYGTGLGGRVSRWDARTGQVANVAPWPVGGYGKRPTTLKYHYGWVTPMAASTTQPAALYLGAQVLFRSIDRGEHWQTLGGDLTGKVEGTPDCDKDLPVARAKACGYGLIYSIAPSPLAADEIWVGTDDGLIQLTRDGGGHWAEVTPKDLPEWARVDSVDVSALDRGTAYIVADNHRQDDFRPHAWRTHDFGKTWQDIAAGLPQQDYAAVVRADPQRRGLLYAGTYSGVFVSLNDGDSWQPLQAKLPRALVNDLLVHGDDLIAATQGRALWVMDDVAPLRELGKDALKAPAHLFAPAVALRVHADNNKDTPLPPETPAGENPPDGAVIDYALGAGIKGPVALEIRDADGKLVRRFASDEVPPHLNVDRYFAKSWLQGSPVPAATPGMHRFVWDLHYARPRAIHYEYSIAAVAGRDTPALPQGPFAVPGRYDVVLKAGGRDYHAPLLVREDPRIHAGDAELHDALMLSLEIGERLEQAYVAAGEAQSARKQLGALKDDSKVKSADAILTAVNSLLADSEPLVTGKPGRTADFSSNSGVLAGIETDLESADTAPTEAQRAVVVEYSANLRRALDSWQNLRDGKLAALNLQLHAAGLPEVKIPPAEVVSVEAGAAGEDLP
jgi:photosystem II stability/assembly factor-like uncharacterized protein